MNRERLTLVRDHLSRLPDEQVDMSIVETTRGCGTVACIAGWTNVISENRGFGTSRAGEWLELSDPQQQRLFYAEDVTGRPVADLDDLTRADAIAAIQSMLDNPDDDALPVWPEVEE